MKKRFLFPLIAVAAYGGMKIVSHFDRLATDEHYHAQCIVFGKDEKAIAALRRCVAKGDVHSTLQLSEMLRMRGDAKEADALLHSVLDRPGGEGEYLIATEGVIAKDGMTYSMPRDKALDWLMKAKAKGWDVSDVMIARHLVDLKRYGEAAPILDRIGKADPVKAARLAENMPNAVRWMMPGAEAGDALVQYRLAHMHRLGTGGARKSQAGYEEWTMKSAAKGGWLSSVLNAAELLEKGGVVVRRDRVAAIAMYRKALPLVDSSYPQDARRIEEKIALLEKQRN